MNGRKTRDAFPHFVRVAPIEKRRMLLPEPPVGQLNEKEIMDADLTVLAEIVERRGLSLTKLFKRARWQQMGSSRELAISSLWTKEHNVRFALLQLDGRSAVELAEIFQISLVSAKGRMTRMRTWLVPVLKDVPGFARQTRKWHELLKPPDEESERMLQELQAQYGNIPRDRIFRIPAERLNQGEEMGRSGRAISARNMLDYDILIRILHMRFVEKKSPEEILTNIEPDVGRKSMGALNAFYTRTLTLEARIAFGIEVHKTWTTKEYRTAVKILLENESATYAEIGRTLQRTSGGTYQGLTMAGKRLVATNEEYANDIDTPLVPLILEYAPKSSFPEGLDPRVVAMRIQSLHVREEQVPE